VSRLAAQARIARPSEENRSTMPNAMSVSKLAAIISPYWPSMRLPSNPSASPGTHGGRVCGRVPSSSSVALPTIAPNTMVASNTAAPSAFL